MLSTYLPPGLSAKEIAERLVEDDVVEYFVITDDSSQIFGTTPLPKIDGVECTSEENVRRVLADLIEHIRSER